ncbi:pentapeptide repeat-containing protein [Achromobacter denitrificans]|uniref:pentapeptide repeat-containing protein n=1 Tax=Achromobacter denitrificans TaxID=32002 RepID=UPI000F691DE9|nr:pentapeptide repeat-containing protein [Achromobacter denitrificans]RSE85550.1 pentapeptide repeat-containing protein [Achromobacter denitrificans]
MKHQIKNIYGAVLFTADVPEGTESGLITRVALEQAVEDGANLDGANLARANLADANLDGANLARANLADANLAGANLARAYLARADLADAYLARAYLAELRGIWGASGNLREVKAIQCDTWPVTYTATHMQIGCQLHALEAWWAFTDEQINEMACGALAWWQKWKPVLHTIVTMSPAVPGAERPAEQQEAA